MAEMKLNRKLLEKMIVQLEETPTLFDQDVPYAKKRSYGTVCCLAGWAIVCTAPSIHEGNKQAVGILDYPDPTTLMGLPADHTIFAISAMGWPKEFRKQYDDAHGDHAKEAHAAINLLRAILRTDGKILEG